MSIASPSPIALGAASRVAPSTRIRVGRGAATASIARRVCKCARRESISATVPQLQCIGCGLCIDGCDAVMDRVERPRGLIAWTTLAADAVAAAGGKPRYRLIRPRTIVYAAMLLLVAGMMAGALALKSTVEFSVQRDRSPQFVRLADGSIRNGYTLHILNKTRHERSFHLQGEGLEGLALTLAGETARVADLDLVVPADSVGTFTLLVRIPASEVKGALSPLEFVLRDPDGHELIRKATVFAGPGST